jgi:hypothetical protein
VSDSDHSACGGGYVYSPLTEDFTFLFECATPCVSGSTACSC